MRISLPLRISMTFVVAAVIYGCAQSEPWDIDVLQPDGGGPSGGMTGSGTGGDGSSSGGTQGTGTGGTGDVGSGGSAGNGGGIGTGGITTGSGGFKGTGGLGAGGTGSGGFTGTGGIKGTGGTTGSGGRGGSLGTGGTGAKGGTTGTGGLTGSGGTTGTGGAGGAAPTFTQIYTQILVVYCAGTQCHDPGSQHNVAFSTQSGAYSSVKSLVTPGNATNSSFYKTVNGGSMPPGGPKLSAANLALIAAWINAGALNN
jgi:hypothetical protein